MGHRLLIVNYHYIRESGVQRGIYHITPSQFKRQLELIYRDGYKYISLNDLHDAIRNRDESMLDQKSCLITFDDGLKESYEIGNSILESMGISGAFYICSSMISCTKVLDVHKYHYIQSKMSDDEILSFIPVDVISELNSVPEDIIKNQYFWDKFSTARLKYLINFLLNPIIKAEIISQLFKLCIESEEVFAKNLYMTKEQIKYLAVKGRLGSHGVSHRPLSLVGVDDLDQEIRVSCSDLESLTGYPIDSISYPYGGESAVNEMVFEFTKNQKIASGMTMIRGLNSTADILFRPLQLKRFDTNDIFGGKSEGIYRELFL